MSTSSSSPALNAEKVAKQPPPGEQPGTSEKEQSVSFPFGKITVKVMGDPPSKNPKTTGSSAGQPSKNPKTTAGATGQPKKDDTAAGSKKWSVNISIDFDDYEDTDNKS